MPMVRELSAGGVVLRKMRGRWYLAVIEPHIDRPRRNIKLRKSKRTPTDAELVALGEQFEEAIAGLAKLGPRRLREAVDELARSGKRLARLEFQNRVGGGKSQPSIGTGGGLHQRRGIGPAPGENRGTGDVA